ncbi:N-acylneuraminate-9-phosphatase [Aethina tumida]|uniref:N-acylneuraminate-9-phosphatase n=1 Tax=Aethina tumida TaxID=116153 RepID=UPI00096B179D|nr:N-acylneuraminate-9-phosphatase [Aethina tumida]
MDNESGDNQLRAIFFDLDNTLIETRKADNLAITKLSKTLKDKYSVPTEACKHYLKEFRLCPDNPRTDLDSWRKYLWSQALGDEYNKYTDEAYKKWLKLRYQYLSLTPDIENMLLKLRESYFLVLITNGPSAAQWEKVNQLNLKPYFDLILVSGDLDWEKPHPKIFDLACEYVGIEPHQAIMIGDKLHTDILGGIQAKLGGTVWLPLNNQKLEKNDPKPDHVIKKVTDLMNLLPESSKRPVFNNRRLFVPELEDCNSNSSDGS